MAAFTNIIMISRTYNPQTDFSGREMEIVIFYGNSVSHQECKTWIDTSGKRIMKRTLFGVSAPETGGAYQDAMILAVRHNEVDIVYFLMHKKGREHYASIRRDLCAICNRKSIELCGLLGVNI